MEKSSTSPGQKVEAEFRLTDEITASFGLTRLSGKTPASLGQAAGVDPKAKAFAVFYAATEARVTDGYTDHGFSYYGVYAPLMSHPMIACAATTCDFGSDDSEPRHMLLFEVGGAIYFGSYASVQRLLSKVNVHLLKTERELEEMLERMNGAGLDGFRQMGGFEFILGATPENNALGGQVIQELDAQITWMIIEELSACNGPGMEAMNALVYADRNAKRLGLDPDRVRQAKEAYEKKLLADLRDGLLGFIGSRPE